MFDNIGNKIKMLAKVVCWIGIIASVIGAIALWSTTTRVSSYSGYYSSYKTVHPYVWQGFVVLIVGCLASWISTWVLYAFGQLVENSDAQVSHNEELHKQNEEILRQLKKMNGEEPESKPTAASKPSPVVHIAPKPQTDGKSIQWNMKTCKKCGVSYSENQIFCPACGEMQMNANTSDRQLKRYEDIIQQP